MLNVVFKYENVKGKTNRMNCTLYSGIVLYDSYTLYHVLLSDVVRLVNIKCIECMSTCWIRLNNLCWALMWKLVDYALCNVQHRFLCYIFSSFQVKKKIGKQIYEMEKCFWRHYQQNTAQTLTHIHHAMAYLTLFFSFLSISCSKWVSVCKYVLYNSNWTNTNGCARVKFMQNGKTPFSYYLTPSNKTLIIQSFYAFIHKIEITRKSEIERFHIFPWPKIE